MDGKEDHVHFWKGVLWSPSYFASSCGKEPIEIIRANTSNSNNGLPTNKCSSYAALTLYPRHE
jgi:REP element-mobilizing transposase RayT